MGQGSPGATRRPPHPHVGRAAALRTTLGHQRRPGPATARRLPRGGRARRTAHNVGDAISASAHAHHRYAVALDALRRAIPASALNVPDLNAATRAVLAAVDDLDRAWGRDNPA